MGITIGGKLVKSIVTEGWINLVGVDIWHNIGETTNTSLPPIIMIHGMFGGGWYFESWAKFLCEKGHDVYVIRDLHCGLDIAKVKFCDYVKKSGVVFEGLALRSKDVDKFKPIIIGHSMGGLIAQKLAEEYQDLIRGIVLVTSAPPKGISLVRWRVAKAMLKYLSSLIFNLPLRIDKKSAFELLFNWLGDEKRKEQFFKKLVPESPKVAKEMAFSQIAVDEKKIECKSLVVAGVYDKLLPSEIQQKIAEKYDSNYASFLTGHMPMLERCQEDVIAQIYNWIRLI